MIEQNQETGKFTFQLLRRLVYRHFKSTAESKNKQTPKSIHHGNAVFYRCGSPQRLTYQKKAILAEMYYKEEKLGVDGIAKTVGISKMTLYKYLRLCCIKISAYQSHQKKDSK